MDFVLFASFICGMDVFFILFYANLIFKLSPECSHFLASWWGFSMIPLAPMCDICASPKNMTDRYTRGEMGPLSFELTTKLSVMIAKSLANSAKYICNLFPRKTMYPKLLFSFTWQVLYTALHKHCTWRPATK